MLGQSKAMAALTQKEPLLYALVDAEQIAHTSARSDERGWVVLCVEGEPRG